MSLRLADGDVADGDPTNHTRLGVGSPPNLARFTSTESNGRGKGEQILEPLGQVFVRGSNRWRLVASRIGDHHDH